jgi:DNA-binding MarR family transcriptional regulator
MRLRPAGQPGGRSRPHTALGKENANGRGGLSGGRLGRPMTTTRPSGDAHADRPDAVRAQETRNHKFHELVEARLREEGTPIDARANVAFYTLVRAANLLTTDFDATVWRQYGVTYAGFRVIFAVWAAGPLEPRAIASLASVSRASVSSVINTLERDGYVIRKRESADRRLVTVSLTEKGHQLWEESFVQQNARERQWASSLSTEEQDLLISLLRRIIHDRPRD